jgi:hypothetical protein
MVTKKNPITDPDGSKAAAKAAKQTDKKARAKLKERFEKPLETVSNVAQGAASVVNKAAEVIGTGVNAGKQVANGLKSIRQAVSGGSQLVTQDATESYKQASEIAQQYGILEQDIKALLGTDPYTADGSSPEQTAGEAKKQQLKLQRQLNAQETRAAKIKLGRKIVQNQREETRLIGDVVDLHTSRIETGTKVVTNQIANTKYNIEQSKLEETEEFLTQQQIRTQGTLSLTDGIREEQDLKYQRQKAKNDGLRLEVEGAITAIERKREEMEAFLEG